MKVLRATTYPPDLNPLHVVLRECDITVPLEEVGGEEFGFMISDIFTIDGEPEIPSATVVALNRWGACKDAERNQAIMYYWTFAQFRVMVSGGVIISNKPAPLTEEQMRAVWVQLAKLPEYDNYRFTAVTKDGETITYPERES